MQFFQRSYILFLLASVSCTFSYAFLSEEGIRNYFFPSDVTSLPISDWKNPTIDDYFIIQKYLNKRAATIAAKPAGPKCFHKEIEDWICSRLARLQLVDTYENPPQFNILYINNNPEKKDKCVICYAGYNDAYPRDYRKGIKSLIKSLKKFGFDGHLIYRVGGWPSLQRDRLKLVDVPYAFKPFLFEEVRDLGYKKILWLDAAAMPVKSLEPLFDVMTKYGGCFFAQGPMPMSSSYGWRYVMRSLGLKKNKGFLDIVTQVVGLDLDHPGAVRLLERWIEAAEKKVPFLQPAPDQFSFALLAHELDMLRGELPDHFYEEGKPLDFKRRNPSAIIFHQYDFLNPNAVIPEDVFE